MKNLIITVGTRQIGWHCSDGIIRSLGADGDRNHPKHIDQLYQELGIERGHHDDEHANYPWGVRHLGEILYHQCKADRDFSKVELLLDAVILEQHIQQGLDHVILWGTDQPNSVSWQYRRADTLWLTELMAAKIQQAWPQIKVDIWKPVVPANRPDLIRQELEVFLLEYLQRCFKADSNDSLTLMIQAKGSAPLIANTLEICAAAVIRQCTVIQVTPIEPDPLFKTVGENQSAEAAQSFDEISLGEYFWPLERSRILSAWQRGDFSEAKVWLGAHRDRYEAIYTLANHLALAANGQLSEAIQHIESWLSSAPLIQCSEKTERELWSEYLARATSTPATPVSDLVQSLESLLLIERFLYGGSYSRAFLWFTQTLERVLYLRGQQEHWQQKGIVRGSRPTLGSWIRGWKELHINNPDWRSETLYRILNLRNELVHCGRSVSLSDLNNLWSLLPTQFDSKSIEPMRLMLTEVTIGCFQFPDVTLLKVLYEWGFREINES